MDLVSSAVSAFLSILGPHLWWLLPLALLLAVLRFPMLGRGPNSSQRDVWRTFKFGPRATVMQRAGGRCEAPVLLSWGRCDARATEVDHVMPWSRGGPTVVSNGQALCRHHNRSKGATVPAWWYVMGLERRRRTYFPADEDLRVFAVMSANDRVMRDRPMRTA